MHEKLDKFLTDVCANIKYEPVHQEIKDELTVHVNELKEEFLRETGNEEEALNRAITAMGDSDGIGRELNRRHKPQTEWSIIVLTAIIAIVGGIVMYVNSSQFDAKSRVDFEQYLIYAMAGLLLMAGLYFFDYTRLKKLAGIFYLLALALCFFPIIFGDAKTASSFVVIGSGISMEVILLFFVISFAGFIDKYRGKGSVALLKFGILATISILPIITRHRFTLALTLLIVISVLVCMAVVKNHFGGSKNGQFIILGTTAALWIVVSVSLVFSSDYRLKRLLDLITGRQTDPNGVDYLPNMADKWLAASNLFGATSEKINGGTLNATLPYGATDYALVNVFATLGSAAGIGLVIAIAVYIIKLFVTTGKIKNSFGFFLSLAACTVLAIQFITGILVNFHLLPFFGVYVPFVSYGGTGYINSMAFIGLVLSVWRRNNQLQAPPKRKNDGAADFIEFCDGKLIVDFKLLRKS